MTPLEALLLLAALLLAGPAAAGGQRARRAPGRLLRAVAVNGSSNAAPIVFAQNPQPMGKWESGYNTGVVFIYASMMKDGEIVGWSNKGDKSNGWTEDGYGTGVFFPGSRKETKVLPQCGVHDCKNAFCSGQVTTADNHLLIFGGHGQDNDLTGFRNYDGGSGTITSTNMQSGRWYPSPCTLPDGRVLVVGGVRKNGQSGYFPNVKVNDRDTNDNPTFTVFDPATGKFSDDDWGMSDQLMEAWPVHTYPHVMVAPDGGGVVSAGSTLVKYDRTGPDTFKKAFSYPNRPHTPWSYPQTGQGTVLPMFPPYDKMYFLAAGGSTEDRATNSTPASDKVHLIELTGGAEAQWAEKNDMPYPRILGDALVLCDGSVGVFGGGQRGVAGWGMHAYDYEFRDGTSWSCKNLCTDVYDFLYEPTIWDPATGKWTPKGALAEHSRPRLYHAVSILLPSCQVMIAGSDVSNDRTAEIYTPPYLTKGPRPTIVSAPDTIKPGDNIVLKYTTTDPVTKAILMRTGAHTHSMNFDNRALWLDISANSNGSITLKTPPSSNLTPPGMYMVVLLSNKGVPSEAKILSITTLGADGADVAASAPTPEGDTTASAPAPAE